MNRIELILFVIYPYLALAICIFACIMRYDRDPYSWKADSSQIMSKKGTRLANNLFHIGILGIFFGHLVGLLTPHWLYAPLISAPQKQMLAIVLGGIAGACVMAGLILIIRRRWGNPRLAKNSRFADKAIVILLLTQVSLGMLSIVYSLGHLDGAVMLRLAEYFQRGLLLDAYHGYLGIQDVAWVYKAHLLLGFTIILLIPFSRLVHAISAPIWYLGRNYQIIRARRYQRKECPICKILQSSPEHER